MFDQLKIEIKKRFEKPIPIHPDFQILYRTKELDWFQNREFKLGDRITKKIAFPLDDVSLLDNCPFAAKVGKNLEGNSKYFALIYGAAEDVSKMEDWIHSKGIPSAKLFEEEAGGAYIRDIN